MQHNAHISTGVVASDIPAFRDIVIRAGIRTKKPAGNFMLVKGLWRRLEKDVGQRIVILLKPLPPLPWVALTW